VATTHGWCHPGPGRLAIIVWYLQIFIKCRLGILSSLPAWASNGEDLGRLLAQPALHAEPASSAGGRDDPWDANRQVSLPSAYLGGHPYITYASAHHIVEHRIIEPDKKSEQKLGSTHSDWKTFFFAQRIQDCPAWPVHTGDWRSKLGSLYLCWAPPTCMSRFPT
jgi:hypothetical protein